MINKTKLAEIIKDNQGENTNSETLDRSENLEVIDRTETIEIILHIAFRSYSYAGKKIAYSANGNAISINKTNHDQTLIHAITRSYKWNKMLDSVEVKTVQEIASKENVERTYASDILKLKYLAPEITAMAMNVTQPRTLNLTSLTDQKIPMCWNEQKQLLNIAYIPNYVGG